MAPALIGGVEPIFDNPLSVFKEGLNQGPFSALRGSRFSTWSAFQVGAGRHKLSVVKSRHWDVV